MIPLDPQQAAIPDLVRLAERTQASIKKSFTDLIRSLELAAAAKERFSKTVRAELSHGADYWKAHLERYETLLAEAESLRPSILERLTATLPPDRALHCFALERLSGTFLHVCAEFGPDRLDVLVTVLTSMHREDPSVSLNLLDHVLEGAPNFYAALMLKGSLLLESGISTVEAPYLFERAAGNPPQVDQPGRYRVLALELLGESISRTDQPAEAVKAYRRIQKLVSSDARFDYHAARVLAKGRKVSEALTTFDVMLRADSHYYPVALLNDDFASIREQLTLKLEERSSHWAQTIDSVLTHAESVRIIADDYELSDHPGIQRGLRELFTIREGARRGSYTGFREIGMGPLQEWTKQWVGLVQDTLQNSLNAKLESIRHYNLSLQELVKNRRLRWVRTWGIIWFLAGLFVTLFFVAAREPVGRAILFYMLWILTGYMLRMYLDGRYSRELKEKEKDPAMLAPIEEDIQRVGKMRSEMLILLERETDLERTV